MFWFETIWCGGGLFCFLGLSLFSRFYFYILQSESMSVITYLSWWNGQSWYVLITCYHTTLQAQVCLKEERTLCAGFSSQPWKWGVVDLQLLGRNPQLIAERESVDEHSFLTFQKLSLWIECSALASRVFSGRESHASAVTTPPLLDWLPFPVPLINHGLSNSYLGIYFWKNPNQDSWQF